MDNKTKIRLSSFEHELVNDADWILTKNEILKKVEAILGEVQQNTFADLAALPLEVTAISPKISKGENYDGLPWRMLDYPRYFNKENIFAIRTMFWWGHFFSTTLHLSGHCMHTHRQRLEEAYDDLAAARFYCSVSDDPWQHHYREDNYVAVKQLDKDAFRGTLSNRPFIKLSCQTSFASWDESVEILGGNVKKIVSWLT